MAQLERSGPFLAVGGMAVAFFLYGYSAIALPGWFNSLVLPLVWLALLVLTTRWFSTRPRLSTALPVLATAIWFAAMLGR